MNYKFEIKVYVETRPHYRDPNLEYVKMLGFGVLVDIFDNEKVREDVTTLSLYYPELNLNIIEERSLYMRLERFCPNLKSLQIITGSVYILQTTKASDTLIVTSEPDISNMQESATGRLWRKPIHGYDFSKLQVL